MSSLLDVSDLRVGFGRAPDVNEVVHGVSFSVAPGETLAIVGESGSGKSVTALSINRLIDFGGGRILRGEVGFRRADGSRCDLAQADEPILAGIRGNEISMIFQEPMTSLNPVLSIGRQIAESFRLHRGLSNRQATAAARDALERVRISDAAARLGYYPHQLSGGMLQRVMIAMAIACNPRLLIADEPTTALDVTVQAQIMALLAKLRQEIGMAVIFITHDIALVAGVADRILVMQHGEAVEQGDLGQVLDHPRHPYTQRLLRAAPHFSSGRATRADAPRRTENAADPILDVADLVVRFPVPAGLFRRSRGAVHAIDGVDFDLASGETLGLVGESGSGKSTTARALFGLIRPTRGAIVATPRRSPAREPNQSIQMVFQNPYASLNPRLTVASLLAEPLIAAGPHRASDLRAKTRAMLERVGLPTDCLGRYPHEFSGGQRQRLCIARALMPEPSIVVLDEAVSALDVSVQAMVLELLVDLQRDLDLAYLFISHDIAVVERIAHRIAVMRAGQIVEIGDAASVLSAPRHSYTRRLIASAPTMDRRRQRFHVDTGHIPSLVRPAGFAPGPPRWRRFGADHKARIEDCPPAQA